MAQATNARTSIQFNTKELNDFRNTLSKYYSTHCDVAAKKLDISAMIENLDGTIKDTREMLNGTSEYTTLIDTDTLEAQLTQFTTRRNELIEARNKQTEILNDAKTKMYALISDAVVAHIANTEYSNAQAIVEFFDDNNITATVDDALVQRLANAITGVKKASNRQIVKTSALTTTMKSNDIKQLFAGALTDELVSLEVLSTHKFAKKYLALVAPKKKN